MLLSMLNIDHLEPVNEIYRHAMGDVVITPLASLLR
jgi:GGDEF domain-containing protein